jgi:hypothetical protein
MQMQLHLPLLPFLSVKRPHPIIPHAQKTTASVKIVFNRPGCDKYWNNAPVSLQLLQTKGEPLFISFPDQRLYASNIDVDIPLPPPHFSFCHAKTLLFEKEGK